MAFAIKLFADAAETAAETAAESAAETVAESAAGALVDKVVSTVVQNPLIAAGAVVGAGVVGYAGYRLVKWLRS